MKMKVDGTRHRGRARKTWSVPRRMWRVWACPKRMQRPGMDGEGKSREQSVNSGSPGNWPLKRCACVCVTRAV